MEYKLILKNQLASLSGLMIFTILLMITVWLVGLNEGFGSDLFFFFSVFYLINLLPVIFVHYQYYNANKDKELLIEMDKKQLLIKTHNSVKTINFKEIQKIEIYMMPSMYRGINFQLFPFESYHYAVIETKDKEKIIITSLIVVNLTKLFTDLNINVVRKRCIFPNINSSIDRLT